MDDLPEADQGGKLAVAAPGVHKAHQRLDVARQYPGDVLSPAALQQAGIGVLDRHVQGKEPGFALARPRDGRDMAMSVPEQFAEPPVEDRRDIAQGQAASPGFRLAGDLPGNVACGLVAILVRVGPRRRVRARRRRGVARRVAGDAFGARRDQPFAFRARGAVLAALSDAEMVADTRRHPGGVDAVGFDLSGERREPAPARIRRFLPFLPTVPVFFAVGVDFPPPQALDLLRLFLASAGIDLLLQNFPGRVAELVAKRPLLGRRLPAPARLRRDPVDDRNPLRDDEFGVGPGEFRHVDRRVEIVVASDDAPQPARRFAFDITPAVRLDDEHGCLRLPGRRGVLRYGRRRASVQGPAAPFRPRFSLRRSRRSREWR